MGPGKWSVFLWPLMQRNAINSFLNDKRIKFLWILQKKFSQKLSITLVMNIEKKQVVWDTLQ